MIFDYFCTLLSMAHSFNFQPLFPKLARYMFVMVFIEVIEEKEVAVSLLLYNTIPQNVKYCGVLSKYWGVLSSTGGVLSGQIMCRSGLGLQPSGDSAASYLNF